MLQASIGDGLTFDPISLLQDGLATSEIDVSRREVFEALVIAIVIVVRHEGGDALFEIAWQI